MTIKKANFAKSAVLRNQRDCLNSRDSKFLQVSQDFHSWFLNIMGYLRSLQCSLMWIDCKKISANLTVWFNAASLEFGNIFVKFDTFPDSILGDQVWIVSNSGTCNKAKVNMVYDNVPNSRSDILYAFISESHILTMLFCSQLFLDLKANPPVIISMQDLATHLVFGGFF